MCTKLKIIKFFAILPLLQTIHLFADVKFNFTYADRPGQGFHVRPEAKAALEEIAHTIGTNWLKHHHSNIFIQVISKENKCDACDNTSYINHLNNQSSSVHHSSIQQKILKSQTFQDKIFDDILFVDFSCSYSFNDVVNENQCDFKALMLHKMTQLLGFSSSIPNNPISLKKSINNFIKKVFYYCFNNSSDSKLDELIQDMNFFQSINFNFDEYIFQQASSSFEILQAEFIVAFKNDIINNIPVDKARYPLYYKIIVDSLECINSNIEEFLALNYNDPKELIAQMLQFGLEKISGPVSSTLDIVKLKKNFLIFYSLNQQDDNYARHLEDFIATVPLPEPYLECLEKIIQFSSQHFIEKMDDKKISQLRSEIADTSLWASITLESLISLYHKKTMEVSFTYFDQFIINQNNERLFNKRKKLTTNHSSLFFKGPKVLQYLCKPIPLQSSNPGYILPEEKSLMNVFNKKGLQLHHWDEYTTAILLD